RPAIATPTEWRVPPPGSLPRHRTSRRCAVARGGGGARRVTALIFNAAATGNSRDAPESSADDGAIPRRHDALAGWAAFRVLRQRPMPTPPRRHGNRKHGGYSKAGRESARWLRTWVRLLRRGVWDERLALPRRPKAP